MIDKMTVVTAVATSVIINVATTLIVIILILLTDHHLVPLFGQQKWLKCDAIRMLFSILGSQIMPGTTLLV